jgi:RNA polymerase sporulation-specific sigma factor
MVNTKERKEKQRPTTEEVVEYIKQARNGDERAFEFLLDLVKPEFKSVQRNKFVFGNEEDDNNQECAIMLMAALDHFDPKRCKSKNNSFNYYVRMLCNGQLISLIQGSKRHKNYTLNAALANSLDAVVYEDPDGSTYHLGDAIASDEELVSDQLERRQHVDFLKSKLYPHLTELERDAFELHLDEWSYAEIANKLRTDTKAIDNAIQRTKNKIPLVMEREIKEYEKHGGFRIKRKKPRKRITPKKEAKRKTGVTSRLRRQDERISKRK